MTYDNTNRTNRGTLGRNNRRRNDRDDPEYSGSINIDGVEYWLNAWVKEGRNGKFFSLSVRPKDAATGSHSRSTAEEPQEEDIPF